MLSVMCGRSTYKLTWEEIVALYRLTLDQPARNTQALNVASFNSLSGFDRFEMIPHGFGSDTALPTKPPLAC
jgi:hypothetical protein